MGRPSYVQPEPRAVNDEQAEWRYNWLTRWARLTGKPSDIASARDIDTVDRLLAQHGLTDAAKAFIGHLERGRARWTGGARQ
jgi:hypothetical protein